MKKTIKDLLNEIFVRFYNINIELCHLYFNGRDLRNYDKSIKIKNIFDDPSRILIIPKGNVVGGILLEKEINIKFINQTLFIKRNIIKNG